MHRNHTPTEQLACINEKNMKNDGTKLLTSHRLQTLCIPNVNIFLLPDTNKA